MLEQHLCSQAADRHNVLQARMQPGPSGYILNITALGWAFSETWALSTSLLLKHRGHHSSTCQQSFKKNYCFTFSNFIESFSDFFFHPPCDVSSSACVLKAFFISRCQPAYPFTHSRPDCSCEWTNSPLTVLPLFFACSAQIGWRWPASSRWPVVTGGLTGDNYRDWQIYNDEAHLPSFLS